MKGNEPQKDYSEIYLDLRELVKTFTHSWKLIILITLASSLLAFVYSTFEEPKYKSSFLLEIGSYVSIEKEKKIFEPVSTLIKELKIELIHKQRLSRNALEFTNIEDQILEVSFTSPSISINEDLLKKVLKFTQDRQPKIIDNISNSISKEINLLVDKINYINESLVAKKETNKVNTINAIKAIDDQISYINESLVAEKETNKVNTINAIKAIDDQIPSLKSKADYLLTLIPQEEENLTLLQSNVDALIIRASQSPTLQQLIYSYKSEILDIEDDIKTLNHKRSILEAQLKTIEVDNVKSEKLFELNQERTSLEAQLKPIEVDNVKSEKLFELNQERTSLEAQLKTIEVDNIKSEKLFELNQERTSLEAHLKLVKNQNNITQQIHKVITNEIKNNLKIIILGTILGFIISIFLALTRKTFNEKQS